MSDSGRLSALRQSRLLDSPPEAAFDRLTALGRRMLGAPVCVFSLVEIDRQFFKSQQGLPEPLATTRETPLSHLLCQHVVASGAPLAIDDASRHSLACDNSAVRDLGIAAYLGVPVRSPEGDVLGSFCVVDVTPRAWTDDDRAVLLDLAAIAEETIALRAEASTRARIETQYRALLESSPDAVLVLEPLTETVLDANGPACVLYGRTRDDLVGSSMRAASPDAAAGETAVAGLLADGGTAQFEAVHTRADGTAFDVAICASVVRLGASPVVMSVNRDVTARNRAEGALRASDARYQTFLGLSAEGIWRFDFTDPVPTDLPAAEQVARILAVGQLGECNAAMARMYGFEHPDEITGRSAAAFLDPADARSTAFLTAFVEAGYSLDDAESHERDRDGRPRVFSNTLVGQVEPGPDGRPHLVCAWGTQRDVTDRHAAAVALRDSEEQYRLLVDTATDVILTIDAASTIRYANHAALAVFGYRPDELVGTSLTALMPASQHSRHHAGIDRYVRTGLRGLPWGQVEMRGRRKDGTEVRLAISFGEYVVGGERLFTGIIRDTTAQKLTEEALAQSEAQFRQIAEALPQLVWTSQPDGTHDFFNGRWYAYSGVTPGDEHWQWKDYAHPEDWPESAAQWARSLATGEPYEMEYRIRCAADGQYRWFIGRAEPVRNEAGEVVRWFGTSTDVHDLYETRARLQANGERLRLVQLATDDVVLDWDAESDTVAWSPAVARVLGWPEAVDGTPASWWADRIHPDDRTRVLGACQAVLLGDETALQQEYRFQRGDGTYAFVLDRGHVVRGPGGRVVRIVGTMLDLSVRKAFETELVAAREAAETAARLKSSLLANMSHELRTPLTAILGYAEMLADEAPPDIQDLVEPIARGGQRLMDTLNSVLDLAQIDAGGRVLSAQPLCLLAEAEAVCAALRPLAGAKGLDLRVVGAATGALADGPALQRVLTTLVGNAVKFTDHGSVTVEVSDDGSAAVLRVADTGIGIAAGFLPELFSEFKQESEGDGRQYEGNGLGLAVAKRLVGLMRSEISVESRKGAGSVFTVRLPRATALAVTDPAAPRPAFNPHA